MRSSSSSRNVRRPNNTKDTQQTPTRKCYAFLISSCIFFAVLSAILLTALVLIGKHHAYNILEIFSDGNNELPTPQKYFRLPSDVAPIHYDVLLHPNLDTGDFKGKVNITIRVDERKSSLLVHAKQLSVDSVTLTTRNGNKIPVQNVRVLESLEMVEVTPKYHLPIGQYVVSVEYTGNLVKRIVGFYKSTYKSKNGTKRYFYMNIRPTVMIVLIMKKKTFAY